MSEHQLLLFLLHVLLLLGLAREGGEVVRHWGCSPLSDNLWTL